MKGTKTCCAAGSLTPEWSLHVSHLKCAEGWLAPEWPLHVSHPKWTFTISSATASAVTTTKAAKVIKVTTTFESVWTFILATLAHGWVPLCHLVDFLWHLLVCFLHDLDELACVTPVISRHERQWCAWTTGPTCSADTVHVLLDVVWKVKVDNVCHVFYIETSRSDISGDKNPDNSILQII